MINKKILILPLLRGGGGAFIGLKKIPMTVNIGKYLAEDRKNGKNGISMGKDE